MPGLPGPRKRNVVAGMFNPKAKLDPGQVEDMRMPAPYDVFIDTWENPGHPTRDWEPSAFPGGISPYPHRVLVRPGPQGQIYFPPGSPANQPLPGDPNYSGGGRTQPKQKPTKGSARRR